jgi:hypothetical protein
MFHVVPPGYSDRFLFGWIGQGSDEQDLAQRQADIDKA